MSHKAFFTSSVTKFRQKGDFWGNIINCLCPLSTKKTGKYDSKFDFDASGHDFVDLISMDEIKDEEIAVFFSNTRT